MSFEYAFTRTVIHYNSLKNNQILLILIMLVEVKQKRPLSEKAELPEDEEDETLLSLIVWLPRKDSSPPPAAKIFWWRSSCCRSRTSCLKQRTLCLCLSWAALQVKHPNCLLSWPLIPSIIKILMCFIIVNHINIITFKFRI